MSRIQAVTVKQLRETAESMPPLQRNEDARPLKKGGVDFPMVRLVVQLTFPIMRVEPAFKMCIAGDTSGSMAFYFYPKAVAAEGRPQKRVLLESEDVGSSSSAVNADYRDENHRKAYKFPMKAGKYYVVHGVPHQDHKAIGLPASAACVSVVHVRCLTGDFNELTHHFLECIYHELLVTKGETPPRSAAAPPAVLSTASSGGASLTRARQDDDMQFFFDDCDAGDEDAASDML